ncbi:MAG: YeeE/YedE family protein [Alkalilacustris sp.]
MILRRSGLVALSLVLVAATFAWAGPRAAFLVAIGLGFGLVLEGLRFGFAGPWRALDLDRDARGLIAQLLAIGATAAVALPLLAMAPDELSGAHAPVGIGMILGAFVFGMAMQIVLGCGSGTLVNAGSGNMIGLVALIAFIAGSFAGTLHLGFWTGLGSLPTMSLQGLAGPTGGLVLTAAGLAVVGTVAWRRAEAGKRLPPVRLWIAAGLIAVLAILNLMVAGQPWGIVYGLGLWGAKVAQAGGADLAATAFWAAPGNAERLGASVLTDVTSLTNIGLIFGAYLAMRWRPSPDAPPAMLTLPSWVAIAVAGLVLGYSARMAFGCNVGAFFSGISTGSLHGWVWFGAAFLGSMVGVRLRPWLVIPRATTGREQPA